MKQWYKNIVYLDCWIFDDSLKFASDVSASPEKWCCFQTFRSRRHEKDPWEWTRKWGSSRRWGKDSPDNPDHVSSTYWNFGWRCEKVRFATGSRHPTALPGNAAESHLQEPQSAHLKSCTGRLGSVLAVSYCLLGIFLKRIRKAPFF